MRRSVLLVAPIALLIIGLAGCSASSSKPTSTAAACPSTSVGTTVKSVKVTGAVRQQPSVTFSTPLKATDVQRTLIVTGKGAKTTPGSTVDVALAAYNGSTGKPITESGFGSSATIPVTLSATQTVPGLVTTLTCVPVGSRVVSTMTVQNAFGSSDPTGLNLKKSDSIVFVADVIDRVPTKADGTPVKPRAGLPTVKLAANGDPSITIPKTTPPTTTEVEVLKQGSGDAVQAGDTMLVQYKGVLWRNGKVFDQTWKNAAPVSLQVSQLVKGFQTAVIGQKTGSQVLVVVPPADGYGSAGSGQIKGTDTMVFVIDILKTSR